MRVISGKLRGRDLGSVPAGVRPTSDRVRESLFSAMGSVEGMRVLDLFAGTGALGLEAFSRGASSVVFVERSKRVVRALESRLEMLGLREEPCLRILPVAADRGLKRIAKETEPSFDLVFMDPPYAAHDRATILEALFSGPLLAREAVVVVEGPKRHPLAPVQGARLLEERRYGDTLLTWLAPANPIER